LDIDGTSIEQHDHHGNISREQNESNPMRAMTKSQLARKAGVCEQTLRVWLRDPYIRQQLAPLKLKKQQIILPPRAVQIIAEHYAIEID
jgi:transposase-like protein